MNAQMERSASRIPTSPRGSSRTLMAGLLLILACAGAGRATFAQEVVDQVQRGSGVLPLLSRSDVRGDLELTDEQTDAVNKLNRALPTRMRDLGLGSRDLSTNEKRQRIAQFDEQLGGELKNILLPQQLKRLRQIEFQFRLQATNLSEEIVNEVVVNALHVTDGQLRQWNSIRQEVDREYDRQRIAIRERAQARFLVELNPDQRARWKDLFGVPFLAKEKSTSPRDVSAKKPAP